MMNIKKSKIISYNATYCNACLSSNRVLVALTDDMEIFSKICDVLQKASQKVFLCWECLNIVKKVKKFKNKVLEAQRYLSVQQPKTQNDVPLTLSSLTEQVINDRNTIFVNDTEPKMESSEMIENGNKNIKEENKFQSENEHVKYHNDSDFIEFDESIDYDSKKSHLSSQIKQGGIKNKKIYIKRKKKYEVIYYKLPSKIMKKVKIKPDELNYWLEKERQSYLYKSFDFKCDSCVAGWATKTGLDFHNKTVHSKKVGRYTCEICNCKLNNKPQVIRHIESHYYAIICTLCEFKCYSSKNMIWHIKEHKRVVKCKSCGALFRVVSDFVKHYKSLHRVFVCHHCGKKHYSRKRIVSHLENHLEEFRCDICNSKFSSLRYLRVHKRSQHLENPTERTYCVVCDKQFKNIYLYKQHLYSNLKHANERKAVKKKEKVECPKCGKVYGSKDAMQKHHSYVHENRSKYFCQDCQRYFLNGSRFMDHRRYFHEKLEKPKTKMCTICGRGFYTRKILNNHIRTHTGERPFKCPHCDSKFAQEVALRSHVMHIHLKVKRVKTSSSSLQRQSISLTDEA